VAAAEAPRLDAAHEALSAMDADDLTPDEFLALDAQFHLALAEASGNIVVAAMMAGLRTSIESYVRTAAASISDWPATAGRLRGEHRGILAAIAHHEVDRSRLLIHDHITGYYTQTRLGAEREES
jgi:DNA-binding FadR family transcriptional regulator